MMQELLPLVGFGAGTIILAVIFYHLILWYIPFYITDRTLARMKKNGRKDNVLLHRGLNNADNCRIPRAIADSMMSGTSYNVSRYPLRIKSFMPQDSYWSISFYARNTDNFFVTNDIEVKEKYGNQVTIVLLNSKHHYQPQETEIVVQAPSRIGYIIVRMMVTDTKDPQSLEKVAEVQRRAFAEELRGSITGVEQNAVKYRLSFKMPSGSEFVKILPTLEEALQWVKLEYDFVISADVVNASDSISLPGNLQLSIDQIES